MAAKTVAYITKHKLPCGGRCSSAKVIICLKYPCETDPCNTCTSTHKFVPALVTQGSQSYTTGWNKYILVYQEVDLPAGVTSVETDDIADVFCDDCELAYIKNYITSGLFTELYPLESTVLEDYRTLSDKNNYVLAYKADGTLERKLKVYVRAAINGDSDTPVLVPNTSTIIDYSNKLYDTLNLITVGSDWKLKIPVSGQYRITADFLGTLVGSTAEADALDAYLSNNIYVGGVVRRGITLEPYKIREDEGGFYAVHGTKTEFFNAGDLIDIRVNPSSFPNNVNQEANSSFTTFSLERIFI